MNNDAVDPRALDALEARLGASCRKPVDTPPSESGQRLEVLEEGGPGRPGVVRIVREEPVLELHANPPWTKHRFPERGVRWKVLRATRDYTCQGLPSTPAGHSRSIAPGAQYVRVSLPPRGGAPRWRDHRLCRACAIAARLATEAPQQEAES